MNKWKIVAIVFIVFFVLSLGLVGIVAWGADIQITQLESQNATLTAQVADLTAQLAEAGVLRNPTYKELMDFLERDGTNENTEYRHSNEFAEALFQNASKEGFQPGSITLCCPGKTYYLVVFNTIDRGLINIDPSNDLPLVIEEGESISKLNGLKAPSWDDTILEIVSFLPF